MCPLPVVLALASQALLHKIIADEGVLALGAGLAGNSSPEQLSIVVLLL
jgi:hypothetical protein